MTKATYNQLTVSIPDGWEDGTVVTLIGPSSGSATPMIPRSSGPDRPTVVFKELNALGEPEAFAEAQVAAMQIAAVDLTIAHQGEIDLDGVKAIARELCFGPASSRVRQIHLFFKRDDRLFTVLGTAADDLNFDAVRRASISIASSIRRKG